MNYQLNQLFTPSEIPTKARTSQTGHAEAAWDELHPRVNFKNETF
jgi:hypothetical protein